MLDYSDQTTPSHYEYVVEIDKQSAEKIKQTAFEYMEQVVGWCSQLKASILIDIVLKTRPEKIVEIGVYGGKSLLPMAYALKACEKGIIYGIDPWSAFESVQWVKNENNRAFWSWVDHEGLLNTLADKIGLFHLSKHVILIQNTSEDAPIIEDIGILHIDGNHSDETSYIDVTKWVPHVKSGGWIIFDDMTWYEEGTFTTARAVDWLNKHCHKMAEFSEDCVWGIWVKP